MAEDTQERLRRMIGKMTPRLRDSFLRSVAAIKGQATLAEIERLMLQGRILDAVRITSESFAIFAAAEADLFVFSGQRTGDFISSKIRPTVTFDQTNFQAVAAMRENRLRLVQGFTEQQTQTTRQALLNGIRDGVNPKQQARAFRDSIGLTVKQERIIDNYRRSLEQLSTDSLQRQLRDRRFDRTVASAIESGEPLSKAQIDKMVGRYRARHLKNRAETIARTEALRSVHEGNQEMFRQAVESGALDADSLIQIWNIGGGGRTRPSHRFMANQFRPLGQPFLSGNGNRLRFPGDPRAPASDTIKCRCALGTRFAAAGEESPT